MLIKVLTASMLFLSTVPSLTYNSQKGLKPIIIPKAQVEQEEDAKINEIVRKVKPVINSLIINIEALIQEAKTKKKNELQIDIKDVDFDKVANDCSLEFKVEIIVLVKYFARCGYNVSAKLTAPDMIELTIDWSNKAARV